MFSSSRKACLLLSIMKFLEKKEFMLLSADIKLFLFFLSISSIIFRISCFSSCSFLTFKSILSYSCFTLSYSCKALIFTSPIFDKASLFLSSLFSISVELAFIITSLYFSYSTNCFSRVSASASIFAFAILKLLISSLIFLIDACFSNNFGSFFLSSLCSTFLLVNKF